MEKEVFLSQRFTSLLKQIPTDTPPAWGKMTLQQMVEHFADSTRIASGRKKITEIVTPPEQLEKMRAFCLSEKPFRENTPNPLMPEVPAPVVNHSVEGAITELQKELDYFFRYFRENPLAVTRNPFFGDLNFNENVHLLYKHALHHLKQFGITIHNETTA